MNQLIQELLNIHEELKKFVEDNRNPLILDSLATLETKANEVGRAWSKSWIGYQAYIYYVDFKPIPPGIHFNSEWGDDRSIWREYDPDVVRQRIEESINQNDIELAVQFAGIGKALFDEKRDQVRSILETSKSFHNDSFIEEMLEQTKSLLIPSPDNFVSYMRPKQLVTRASLAGSQGLWTPPHISVLAKVHYLRSPMTVNEKLGSIANKIANHLERLKSEPAKMQIKGNRIFIGHGHSALWKDLKDFLEKRMGLEWDEFNRVPVAGIANISRLSQMLDSAAIAFLVMTAEDEQLDGTKRARMNVIHEAGLFQGRLGFTKAIVLLENGCEEFTNIEGLGHIPFPKGNIKAAFEEIRLVLEREGIIKT